MRIRLLGIVLFAATVVPAAVQGQTQRPESIDRRVTRIEQELRAVQRRVFPGGNAQFVEPEISPPSGGSAGGGAAGDAWVGLAARVDAIEAQLRTLTGQVEESNHRSSEVEGQIGRLRAELSARMERLEAPARAPDEPPAPARPIRNPPSPEPPAPVADASPAVPSDAEGAYNAGFRLWGQHHYAEAQAALEAAANRYPSSRWASWMRNLEGRAYLDDNKPATAARILLANYQNNPQGERAADSLYYLGQALTRLNRSAEACRVYDELASVYPHLRPEIARLVPHARADAHCQ